MKRILLCILVGFAPLAFVQGCKTPSATTVLKTEGVIITTVDTGMQIWSDQVRVGKATQTQVDNVKMAYNAYYTAQLGAKAAIEKIIVTGSTNTVDVVAANNSVLAAENSLLMLLNQYIIK